LLPVESRHFWRLSDLSSTLRPFQLQFYFDTEAGKKCRDLRARGSPLAYFENRMHGRTTPVFTARRYAKRGICRRRLSGLSSIGSICHCIYRKVGCYIDNKSTKWSLIIIVQLCGNNRHFSAVCVQFAINRRSLPGNYTRWAEQYGRFCVKQRRAVHRR